MADHSEEDCEKVCIHHNPALLPPFRSRPFSKLPDEMVAKILSYVPTSSILVSVHRVDERLKRLCFDAVTKMDLKRLRSETPQLSRHQLRRHVGQCRRLKRLRLAPHYDLHHSVALVALKHCPKLEQLEGVHSATPDLTRAIEELGVSLRRLELENSDLKTIRLPRELTHVTLVFCRGLDDGVLGEIGERCENLQSFVTKGNAAQYSQFGMGVFLQAVKGSIRRLSIERVRLPYEDLGQCQLLEALYLHGIKGLQCDRLGAVLRRRKKSLRELEIASCYRAVFDDNTPLNGRDVAVAFSGVKLESLEMLCLTDLDGMGALDLDVIGQGCPNLEVFALGCISEITDHGIRRFAGRCGKLRKMRLDGDCVRRAAEMKRKGFLPDSLEIEMLVIPSTSEHYPNRRRRGLIPGIFV